MESTIHLPHYESFDVDVSSLATDSGRWFTVVDLKFVRPGTAQDDGVTIFVDPKEMAEAADKFEFIASELRGPSSGSVDS